jgi:hypothetical protein
MKKRTKFFEQLDETDKRRVASWGYSAGQLGRSGNGQGAQSGGNARAAQGGGHGSVLRTTHASLLNGKTAAAAAVVRSAPPPIAWQRGVSEQKELSYDLETLEDDEHAWKNFCHVYAGSTELQRATKWAELTPEQRRAFSYMTYAPPSSVLPRLRPDVRMVVGGLAAAQDEAPGGGSGQVEAASPAAARAPKPDSASPPLARTPRALPLPRNTAKPPTIDVAEQSSERPGTQETAGGWSTVLSRGGKPKPKEEQADGTPTSSQECQGAGSGGLTAEVSGVSDKAKDEILALTDTARSKAKVCGEQVDVLGVPASDEDKHVAEKEALSHVIKDLKQMLKTAKKEKAALEKRLHEASVHNVQEPFMVPMSRVEDEARKLNAMRERLVAAIERNGELNTRVNELADSLTQNGDALHTQREANCALAAQLAYTQRQLDLMGSGGGVLVHLLVADEKVTLSLDVLMPGAALPPTPATEPPPKPETAAEAESTLASALAQEAPQL